MQGNSWKELLEEAKRVWEQCRYPIAFTGAGVSVASGIPDFRSPGGLWSKYDPMKVATSEAIKNNPREVWEFLLETSDLLFSCGPNPAHNALADLEKRFGLRGIITQNVDNLHQRAGSMEVVEFHGNFQRFYCQGCMREIELNEIVEKTKEQTPPLCGCHSIIRPDVVFFGEAIPTQAMQRSQALIRNSDLILIAGTSGEVSPANTIPREVKFKGGKIIEFNKGPTYYRDITDIRFDGPVEEILPEFVKKLEV